MRNLHVVSHTHWDREWYMPFQSFRLKLVHLVDEVLDILDRDRNFKYFMLDGQTIILEDYLQMRPEKETILREHIRKGRIIIGPWHILPDMFLVGPEAHIRNLHQGARTARKFGSKMMVGYMPDSFGHIGQIPQILQGFGIEVASVWRGVADEPAEFWWQAPDGSRVLMAFLLEGYGNGADLPADNIVQFARMIKEKGEILARKSSFQDLLIMYGTDHMEPPPNTSKAIAYADKALGDTHVIHSTLPRYVAAVRDSLSKDNIDLPIVTGELRACRRVHLLPGVLSSRMWIKQRNHACESLLTKWAEPFSTWEEIVAGINSTSLDRKPEILRQTWHMLMENHPHDSICGCSIDQVHREMKVRFDQVEQVGEEITRQALESLAGCVDTQKESMAPQEPYAAALVVFNPSSFPRSDIVSATMELPPGIIEYDLVDQDGHCLPCQEHGLGSHAIINLDFDSRGLRSALGNINDGRAAGMTVQDLKVRRVDDHGIIEAVMAQGGEPNLAIWDKGLKLIEDLLDDSSVTNFNVRAFSTSATRIIISVTDIPAHGYRTFWIRPRTLAAKPPMRLGLLANLLLPLARLPILQKMASRKRYARPPYKIENDFFVVDVLKDGSLTVLDKLSNQKYQGLNKFIDGGDCGDEYNYCPPAIDNLASAKLKHVLVVYGSAQQELEIELELSTSRSLSSDRKARSQEKRLLRITSTISLATGVPRVDVRTRVDNQALDHRLRVHFPAPFASVTGAHDGHFEVVERKIGVPAYDDTWAEQPRSEVPQRAFTSVSDGASGLTIANRGLPEVEVLKNSNGNAEIAVTLLRCTGWLSRDDFSTRKGHAGPFMETPEAQVPGIWDFEYSIIPHQGDWQSAYRHAYAFETPMRMVSTGLHSGMLPQSGSFLAVEQAEFIVTAVNQSEDETGWLVRGYNITAQEIQVTLKPWKRFKNVQLVNLAEEKIATLKPARDGSVAFTVGGHKIATILFRN